MQTHLRRWASVQRGAARTVLLSLPVAAAIFVFGTIFGSLSESLIGPELTVAASLLIWSGVVQFSLVGLIMAGAGPTALLLTTLVVNMRNLLLGTIIRPLVPRGPLQRALRAWFLIDETVGLALADKQTADRTLLVSGALCYLSWIAGTVIGMLSGSLAELRGVAEAVFPVLFVGLAALSASGQDAWLRIGAAITLTILARLLLPGLGGLIPVVVALLVAYPEKRS